MEIPHKSIKRILKSIQSFLSFFIPKNKTEISLFIIFMLFYSSYSLIIVFKTSLIDNDFPVDLYFSFDNPPYYFDGYSYAEAHPLVKYFMAPIVLIGNILENIFYYKIKTLFFALFFTTLTSLSGVYIFRYLYEIIKVENIRALLLTLFFCFFSTNMILCFTPESFSLSAFTTISMLLYYSTHITSKKKTSTTVDIFYSLSLGGITFTNFAKGIIAMFFSHEKNKKLFINISIICIVFLIILILTPSFVSTMRFSFKEFGGINKNTISVEGLYFLTLVIDHFFGAPILFPDIYVKQEYALNSLRDMISLSFYHYPWQYIFLGILYSLVLITIIKGIINRNKLLLFLLCLISVDMIIHVVIRYGYKDFFIFGGHWIYAIPLFIGWLYKYIDIKWHKYLTAFIGVLLVVLIINNITKLIQFLELALEYYPA